ncbi:MAG TPA: hypothetical protein VMV57_05660 [Terracidiphilus sp.]|nr:hypothetical protein [Terracidiphilus sp.]
MKDRWTDVEEGSLDLVNSRNWEALLELMLAGWNAAATRNYTGKSPPPSGTPKTAHAERVHGDDWRLKNACVPITLK